jgi:hypothetical protein
LNTIDRICFIDELPKSFCAISSKIYAPLPYSKVENVATIIRLFQEEATKNEIIIYTDHENIRLVGIFTGDTTQAFFGFWETIDNVALNEQAFAVLSQDAQARKRTALIGTLNFNTYQAYRLRLDTPSWVQFDNEPVNPPYYPTLLQKLGFEPTLSFESRLVKKAAIPEVYTHKKILLEAVRHTPFHFIPVTPEIWAKHEIEIFTLIEAIFGKNPFYQSISFEQFQQLFGQKFAQKLCPHSSVIFQDKTTQRLAAISLCHPNFKPLQRPENQAVSFENDYPKLSHKVLLAKSVGVHPDFRKQGVMNFLGAYAMLSFQEYYEEVLFCTMRSDNFSVHFSDNLPYEKARYALFERKL